MRKVALAVFVIPMAMLVIACGGSNTPTPTSTPTPTPTPNTQTGHDVEGNEFTVWITDMEVFVSWDGLEPMSMGPLPAITKDFRLSVADCDGNGADEYILVIKHSEGYRVAVVYDETFYPPGLVPPKVGALHYDVEGNPKGESNEYWHDKLSHCLPSKDF